MAFEKDIERILRKYDGKVITAELIDQIISDYRKLFICSPLAREINDYYNREKIDDASN